MAYIGFYLSMIGLAAAGGALDRGDSLSGAIAMTVAGAIMMRLFREGSKDEEKEKDGGADSGGGAPVDKLPGESGRGCTENTKRGGGRGVSDADNSLPSWKRYRDRPRAKKRNLRGAGRVDRQDCSGMGMHRL